MTQIIMPRNMQKVINENIEEGLEHAREELKLLTKNAIKEIEIQTMADMYAIFTSTKQRGTTAKDVRKLREMEWKEALKKAKGNGEKAFRIWAGLTS